MAGAGTGLTNTELRATPVPVSGSLSISGTNAVTQSGTWTVQPGNTANTTAWKVDGSAVTQPVSSATLGTAANQTTQITAEQAILATTGATSDAATTGTGTLNAHERQTAITVGAISAQLPASLGAKTSANSMSVVLATDSTLTLSGAVTINAIPTGTNVIGHVIVDSGAITLPTGASTAANQSTEITSLASLVTNTTGLATAANQSTSATTLGTIATNTTGAATAANQSTANTSLSSIATNTTDGVVTGPFTQSSATTLVPSTDTAGYQCAVVQITANATFNTVTFQTCNDNSTWVSAAGFNIAAPSTVAATSGTASTWAIPYLGRYFRAQITGYNSGSTTAYLCLKKAPLPIATVTASATGNFGVTGPVTHDSAISGAPVRTGKRVVTTNYATTVVNGDTVDDPATATGAGITKPFSIPEADWQYAAPSGGKTATGGVTIQAAPAASYRNYITGLQISNSGAGGTEVQIKDGAGGTVIWRGFIAATTGVSNINFSTPIRQPTTATLLELDLSSGTTVAVFVNAQGYQAQ